MVVRWEKQAGRKTEMERMARDGMERHWPAETDNTYILRQKLENRLDGLRNGIAKDERNGGNSLACCALNRLDG